MTEALSPSVAQRSPKRAFIAIYAVSLIGIFTGGWPTLAALAAAYFMGRGKPVYADHARFLRNTFAIAFCAWFGPLLVLAVPTLGTAHIPIEMLHLFGFFSLNEFTNRYGNAVAGPLALIALALPFVWVGVAGWFGARLLNGFRRLRKEETPYIAIRRYGLE